MGFIAADSEPAARLVAGRINHAVQLLASNPALGRPGRVLGTREWPVTKTRYIVPYRVNALGELEILSVFHTSRRPTKEW